MKLTPDNFDWLELGLRQLPTKPDCLRLAICFGNRSAERVRLSFSNRTRQAEVFGLRIFDRQGKRVQPERTLYIRPSEDTGEVQEIASGGHWEYILEGKWSATGLEFPGAVYNLKSGLVYHFLFQYQGILSNELSCIPPNASELQGQRLTKSLQPLTLTP